MFFTYFPRLMQAPAIKPAPVTMCIIPSKGGILKLSVGTMNLKMPMVRDANPITDAQILWIFIGSSSLTLHSFCEKKNREGQELESNGKDDHRGN